LLEERSIFVNVNSEVVFTDDDFTFRFFLTISGKKIGIKININIV